MTLTPKVIFDQDPRNQEEGASRIDEVKIAVAPIDVLTGRIVSENITASVSIEVNAGQFLTLPDKPIRNLSGLLVFINLQKSPPYRVQVNAQNSAYFDPEPITFPPANPSVGFDIKKNPRLDVPLYPRPGFSFDEFVTLASGVVLRDGAKVELAKVSVEMKNPDSGFIFESQTDKHGAFVLPISLSTDFDLVDEDVVADFRIHSMDANEDWQLELEWPDLELIQNKRGVFEGPIDLANPDDIKNLVF